MAQDTNSRASMTYDAYKQFVDPIDITPIQQQQQFEEGKRRAGIQQEQFKAKRKDELAKDFSVSLKHGLVPAFAKGINAQFDELRQMYIDGDIDIDSARSQLMGIQQQIAEFKPVSESLREISKNPNDYLYYNPETDEYETGIDSFTRAVFASNGFGEEGAYEQISQGMDYYNRMTTKPEDISSQLASLGNSVWEANAKKFINEPTVEVDENTGNVIIKSKEGRILSGKEVDRIAENMAGSQEFLEAAEIEYKMQGNENLREQYEDEKEYLKSKIKDFIQTSEVEAGLKTYSAKEGGGDEPINTLPITEDIAVDLMVELEENHNSIQGKLPEYYEDEDELEEAKKNENKQYKQAQEIVKKLKGSLAYPVNLDRKQTEKAYTGLGQEGIINKVYLVEKEDGKREYFISGTKSQSQTKRNKDKGTSASTEFRTPYYDKISESTLNSILKEDDRTVEEVFPKEEETVTNPFEK